MPLRRKYTSEKLLACIHRGDPSDLNRGHRHNEKNTHHDKTIHSES